MNGSKRCRSSEVESVRELAGYKHIAPLALESLTDSIKVVRSRSCVLFRSYSRSRSRSSESCPATHWLKAWFSQPVKPAGRGCFHYQDVSISHDRRHFVFI